MQNDTASERRKLDMKVIPVLEKRGSGCHQTAPCWSFLNKRVQLLLQRRQLLEHKIHSVSKDQQPQGEMME